MSKIKIIKLVNLHDNNRLFELKERSNKVLVNINYKGPGRILTNFDISGFNLNLLNVGEENLEILKNLNESLCNGYTYFETHVGDKVMLVNHVLLSPDGVVNLFMEFENKFGTESRVDPTIYTN